MELNFVTSHNSYKFSLSFNGKGKGKVYLRKLDISGNPNLTFEQINDDISKIYQTVKNKPYTQIFS